MLSKLSIRTAKALDAPMLTKFVADAGDATVAEGSLDALRAHLEEAGGRALRSDGDVKRIATALAVVADIGTIPYAEGRRHEYRRLEAVLTGLGLDPRWLRAPVAAERLEELLTS